MAQAIRSAEAGLIRIFEVVLVPAALTLENITLTDGLADSGGAIYKRRYADDSAQHLA